MKHTNNLTSCERLFLEIIKGLRVTVYRYLTLVGCGKHSSDQQAGLKHLTVVGRYDTTGPLADL